MDFFDQAVFGFKGKILGGDRLLTEMYNTRFGTSRDGWGKYKQTYQPFAKDFLDGNGLAATYWYGQTSASADTGFSARDSDSPPTKLPIKVNYYKEYVEVEAWVSINTGTDPLAFDDYRFHVYLPQDTTFDSSTLTGFNNGVHLYIIVTPTDGTVIFYSQIYSGGSLVGGSSTNSTIDFSSLEIVNWKFRISKIKSTGQWFIEWYKKKSSQTTYSLVATHSITPTSSTSNNSFVDVFIRLETSVSGTLPLEIRLHDVYVRAYQEE